MPFASRAEFIEKLKTYYRDPVSLETADEMECLVYNFGFDTNTYYSQETARRLFSQSAHEPLLSPTTRRDLDNERLVQICDWHGVALLQLFKRFGYFNPPAPALPARVHDEAQPLLQQEPQMRMPDYYRSMPDYYRSMARNTIDPLFTECNSLFLEPCVPGMPNQQRLLICPFRASDGATYNLKTLIYLFSSNLPSPITGLPFQNKALTHNSIISFILQDCWNAPAECHEFRYTDKARLNQLRTIEKEAYDSGLKITALINGLEQTLRGRSLGNLELNVGIANQLGQFIDNVREYVMNHSCCECIAVAAQAGLVQMLTTAVQCCTCTVINGYVCSAYTGFVLCYICARAGSRTYQTYAHRRAHPPRLMVVDQPRDISTREDMIRNMIRGASRHLIGEEIATPIQPTP